MCQVNLQSASIPTIRGTFSLLQSPLWVEWGWVTDKLNMLHFPPLPWSTDSKYVVINYCTASAAESKHPEYSGRMTHQIGAVQGAARENTSHFSTLQPTSGISGIDVLVVLSSGQHMHYCAVHTGLHHHLVGRGDLTLSDLRPFMLDCRNRKVIGAYAHRHCTAKLCLLG